MQTYANVQNGIVVEIIVPMTDASGDEIPIESRFTEQLVADLVDITSVTPVPMPGWTYNGISFSAPFFSLAQLQSAQISIVQSSYQSAISQPVTFKNAAGVTSTYPSGNTMSINGQTATGNLADAIDAGSSGWVLGKWLDSNNIAQTFTYADLQGLAAAMSGAISLDWSDLVAKVAAVQAVTDKNPSNPSAATVAAIQAITF